MAGPTVCSNPVVRQRKVTTRRFLDLSNLCEIPRCGRRRVWVLIETPHLCQWSRCTALGQVGYKEHLINVGGSRGKCRPFVVTANWAKKNFLFDTCMHYHNPNRPLNNYLHSPPCPITGLAMWEVKSKTLYLHITSIKAYSMAG